MELPTKEQWPGIIVGGGPVGLSTSILLSIRGIEHVLFERHSSTSIHPKSVGHNQRTTEIYRQMGIEEEIYAHSAPPEIAGRTAWYTSLGPTGKEIYSRDSWGGGEYAAEYATHSPSRYALLPQIRLEPIFKRRAEELNPQGIVFATEVIAVEDGPEQALVRVQHRTSEVNKDYKATFVVIADGGRSLTNQLGIQWLGEGDIMDMVTAHFSAPLRRLHPDPRNFITWFSNPEMGGSVRTGLLYQIGPWPLEENGNEEWVFMFGKLPSDPQVFDEKAVIERLKKTTALGPNFPDLEILSFSHWKVNATYAERWRIGRLFLMGDAAHKIPPFGALGFNTGIQDANNLVWKLALALKDPVKYDGLLDTYETERREVGKRVGETSLFNMRSHSLVVDAALGIKADAPPEENVKAAAPYWDPGHPEHQNKREAVEEASRRLDKEFKAPGYEVGWFYSSADKDGEGGKTHGGQIHPNGDFVYERYVPSTIPGHHLPHIWVEKYGRRCALHDLLSLQKMTLFAEKKCSFAEPNGMTEVVILSDQEGWRDLSGLWAKLKGVGASGGVLVRPDGIVAWRGELDDHDAGSWNELLNGLLEVRDGITKATNGA
jgi:2-polyprenyl-6-methoxyphenol hydroxylase-like FAD-dependent oxidoreductase